MSEIGKAKRLFEDAGLAFRTIPWSWLRNQRSGSMGFLHGP